MMDDTTDSSTGESPEVTISPMDNGHVVRWHQRSFKKGEPGRSVKRVALTKEEALGHADEALGGGGSTKSSMKRSTRGQVGRGTADDAGDQEASASTPAAHSSSRGRARRHRSRVGGRR